MRTCPICKEEVKRVYPKSINTYKGIVYFHDDCFVEFTQRISTLWYILTGPEEDFERFLGE